MSFFCFSVQSQTSLIESWFDGVTSDAKSVSGNKSAVKGFQSAHCLNCKYEFFTSSPLKIRLLFTLKLSSDATWPPSYQAISPTLIFSTDTTAQNRRVAISGSYSQPTQRLNRELFFQPGSNRKYQIAPEYSILKESAVVKTNRCYSATEDVEGDVWPVTTVSCLLKTWPRFISTNSRTNRSGRKLDWEDAFISNIATVGQFNSLSCSAAVPFGGLMIIHKNLNRKREETASPARAFSCKVNCS